MLEESTLEVRQELAAVGLCSEKEQKIQAVAVLLGVDPAPAPLRQGKLVMIDGPNQQPMGRFPVAADVIDHTAASFILD